MHRQQTEAEMADEVLYRQAAAGEREAGIPFVHALDAVLETGAGRQLEQLRDGPESQERAQVWHDRLAIERLEGQLRHFVETETRRASGALSPSSDPNYSWLQLYLETLHGKEVREEYYVRL